MRLRFFPASPELRPSHMCRPAGRSREPCRPGHRRAVTCREPNLGVPGKQRGLGAGPAGRLPLGYATVTPSVLAAGSVGEGVGIRFLRCHGPLHGGLAQVGQCP